MFIVLSDNSDVRSCGNLETEHAVNVLGACIDRIGIQVSATRGDGLRGGPYDTPVSFNYYQSVVQSCKSTKVVNTAFPDGRDLVQLFSNVLNFPLKKTLNSFGSTFICWQTLMKDRNTLRITSRRSLRVEHLYTTKIKPTINKLGVAVEIQRSH